MHINNTIYCLIGFTLLLSNFCSFAANHDLNKGQIDFIHYEAELKPDFSDKSLSGRITIHFTAKADGVHQLVFNGLYKSIEKVTDGQQPLEFSLVDDQLTIHLARPLKQGTTMALTVDYLAKPKRGMRFYEDHLFTVYHTSNWMVAHKNINDKATLDLTLHHDAELVAIVNGSELEQDSNSDAITSSWSLATPVPTYTFGFALGKFKRIQVKQQNRSYHYYYRPETQSRLNKQQVSRIFSDVDHMTSFFEKISGIPLPNNQYRYVVVQGRIAQEAAGFSLVGEDFGHALLKDKHENWFVAHELAHQWWGNSITSQHFGDFWLHEGLVQFLVAAYKEHKFGTKAYDKEIQLAQSRVNKAYQKGKGGPVAQRDAILDSDLNHRMVYNKGALVFHRLRQELGEEAFWQGLRLFSQQHFGGSVTTDNLVAAFEQASGQALKTKIYAWVYSQQPLNPSE